MKKRFVTSENSVVTIISTNNSVRLEAQAAERNEPVSEKRKVQLAASDFIIQEILPGAHIVRSTLGAPELKGATGYVSISHTAHYVGVIFNSKVRVAIDIERTDRSIEHISPRFTTPDELKLCAAVYGHNPALLIWSCKECLFKLMRKREVHFREQLSCISVHSDDGIVTSWSVDHPEIKSQFLVKTFIFDSLLCSIIESPTV